MRIGWLRDRNLCNSVVGCVCRSNGRINNRVVDLARRHAVAKQRRIEEVVALRLRPVLIGTIVAGTTARDIL